MRLAYLSEKLAGKTLARPVYGKGRQTLLRAGIRLTPKYIETLLKKGYTRVYVQNELIPDLQVDEVVSDETRVLAFEAVEEAAQRTVNGERVSLRKVNEIVDQMISELDSDVLFGLTAIRSVSDYTFNHSVNVAILALMLGVRAQLPQAELRDLGIGAMLHDLGKIRIKDSILNKPGPLNSAEWEEMTKHTVLGYELLLRELNTSFPAAHVAYQHHERMDGSGYPRGLKGPDILRIARIAAICDVFDAMTSDRVYREARTPLEATEVLQKEAGTLFDPDLVPEFLRLVAHYPTGSLVQLDTFEVGVVVAQNAAAPDRPRIRIMADREYRLLQSPYEVEIDPKAGPRVGRILKDIPSRIAEQLERRGAIVSGWE